MDLGPSLPKAIDCHIFSFGYYLPLGNLVYGVIGVKVCSGDFYCHVQNCSLDVTNRVKEEAEGVNRGEEG
jgi:hypothetical protein